MGLLTCQSQAVTVRALRARIYHAVAPAELLLAAFRRVSVLAEEAAAALPADPADAECVAGSSPRRWCARIDRAIAPAELLLAAFRRVSALTKEAAEALPADPAYADGAVGFVGHVDQLCDAIEEAVARGDEAVRRVEEVVGFLGQTKAIGRSCVRRLTDAVAAALRAVYEAEAEEMRFEGPLDEALLDLQDLFEAARRRSERPATMGKKRAAGHTRHPAALLDHALQETNARIHAALDCARGYLAGKLPLRLDSGKMMGEGRKKTEKMGDGWKM
uniref:Uncharacterized protein n=1 Tax=Oryza glumipatula TaxID=40148 RepID=A0A0D9YSE1_9ORYZ